MILSEAIKILEANGFGAEISNKRLRKMLDDAGYSDVHLIKGDGYLYVDADDAQHQDWLNALDSTSIYLNSFNQQSPEEWFQDIIVMLRKGRNTFIDKHPDGPEDVNESFDNEIATYVDEMLSANPNKGEIEFTSRGALDDAWDYLKSLGYKLQYTSDVDENDNVTHYIEYVKNVNEDFGIGVGGMTGADQGIPMGGDCKAVVAKRIDGGKPACRFRNMLKKRKKNKGK